VEIAYAPEASRVGDGPVSIALDLKTRIYERVTRRYAMRDDDPLNWMGYKVVHEIVGWADYEEMQRARDTY